MPSTHGYRFLYVQTYESTTTPVYTPSEEIWGYSLAAATESYTTSANIEADVSIAGGYFRVNEAPVYVYTGGNTHAYSYGGDFRGYINGRSTTMRLVTSTGAATPDMCTVAEAEARSTAVAFVLPSPSPSPPPSPPQLSMAATVSPPGPHAVGSIVTLLVTVDHAVSLGMVAIAVAFSTSSVSLVSSSTPLGSPFAGVTTATALVPSHHNIEATLTTASGTAPPASNTSVVNLQMRVLSAGNVTLRGTVHSPDGAVVAQDSAVACDGCSWATT